MCDKMWKATPLATSVGGFWGRASEWGVIDVRVEVHSAWLEVCDGCGRVANGIVAAQQIASYHPRRHRHYETQWRLAPNVVWYDVVLRLKTGDDWCVGWAIWRLRAAAVQLALPQWHLTMSGECSLIILNFLASVYAMFVLFCLIFIAYQYMCYILHCTFSITHSQCQVYSRHFTTECDLLSSTVVHSQKHSYMSSFLQVKSMVSVRLLCLCFCVVSVLESVCRFFFLNVVPGCCAVWLFVPVQLIQCKVQFSSVIFRVA